MKPIHGEPMPFWKAHGLEEFPPVPCQFSVGDKAVYTNEAGLKFEVEVVGFSKDDSFYGRFVHTHRNVSPGKSSAWWFPHKPEELKKL